MPKERDIDGSLTRDDLNTLLDYYPDQGRIFFKGTRDSAVIDRRDKCNVVLDGRNLSASRVAMRMAYGEFATAFKVFHRNRCIHDIRRDNLFLWPASRADHMPSGLMVRPHDPRVPKCCRPNDILNDPNSL